MSRQPVKITRRDWARHAELWRGRIAGEDLDTGATVLFFATEQVGDGPRWHVHPYDEIFIIRQGRALFTCRVVRKPFGRSERHDFFGIRPENEGLDDPGNPDENETCHSVPLSEAAVALLKALPNFEADHKDPKALVFPAPRGGVMSDMTISAVMNRMDEAKAKKDGKGWIDPNVLTTPEDPAEEPQPRPAAPHGLRSTFKDRAAKRGYDNVQSELALAHNVGTEVERRDRRDELVEVRRAMMNAYAAFCLGEEAEASKVVPLRAGVA